MVNVLDDGNSYLLVPRGRLVAPASSQIGCTGGKSLQLCTYWSGGIEGLEEAPTLRTFPRVTVTALRILSVNYLIKISPIVSSSLLA